MPTLRAVVKRRSLSLALLVVGFAGGVQASSIGPVPADQPASSLLSVTSTLVAMPSLWSTGVVESVTLTVLGFALIGVSALLRRVLINADANRKPQPDAKLVDPAAGVRLRRRSIRLRPMQDTVRN